MTKRIPIKAAADIGKAYKQDQVILVTWDASQGLTHVVTWGATKEDCSGAAIGGNAVKTALGWPETLQKYSAGYEDLLKRLKIAQETIRELQDALKTAEAERWNVPS